MHLIQPNLCFQPDPVEDKEMTKLNNIEQSIEKQASKLHDIAHQLDGIDRVNHSNVFPDLGKERCRRH